MIINWGAYLIKMSEKHLGYSCVTCKHSDEL